MQNINLIFLLISLFFMIGCSGHSSDSNSALLRVSKIVDVAPVETLSALKEIDLSSLSDKDKHYYEFLKIKAEDKAYIKHTSDSIIAELMEYYSNSTNDELYAEVLYYGGRVYSDLGDYPTSLALFQEALELTPIDSNIKLRGNILSQTGRLLDDLRLYAEAIPIYKEAIFVDSIERDTFNLAYDYQLLGGAFLYANNLDSARYCLTRAVEYAKNISMADAANMLVVLSDVEIRDGNIKEALRMAREYVQSVDSEYLNRAMIGAAEIYMKAGVLDTAYQYSHKLVHSKDTNNRMHGYRMLLSDALRPFSPSDSLSKYFSRYYAELNELYNQNESLMAMIQASQYNYSIHERERLKAEEKSRRSVILLCSVVAIGLVLANVVVFYKMKSKEAIMRLKLAQSKLKALQSLIPETNADVGNKKESMDANDMESARLMLKRELERIESKGQSVVVSKVILNSNVYEKMQEFILTDKPIPESSKIWQELFGLISEVYPEFWKKITYLMEPPIKLHERQTIALIRCGFSPANMSILLGKTKGAISSRRESLSIRILGEKTHLQTIDAAIRLL